MKCRLCIIEDSGEVGVAIFNEQGDLNLSKLITKYLYLELTKYDEFSTKICYDCNKNLQEFHEFFEKVEERQRQLHASYLDQQKVDTCDIMKKSLNDLEHIEETLIDLNHVETESDNATLTEAEEFGFADVKADNSNTLSNNELILESATSSKSKDKTSKKKTSIIQETSILQKRKRGRPRKDNKNELDLILAANDNETKTNEEHTTEAKNILSPEEEQEKDNFIAKNIELKCEICGEVMLAFKKFRSHFRKKHNRRAYITCCGLRLTQRWRLINHIRLHVDPNHFKCKYCEKMLTTQFGYEMHLANYHGDREEKKHMCEICQKRFSLRNTLKAHMVVHKREANHQCDLCEKCFKTINALQKHVEFVHSERTPFICHVCGKELKTKHNLQTHIAEMHTGIPKSKCSVCDKWVSSSYLKKHKEYHIPKEVECDECGKMFPSEGALRGHKRGLSHKERIFSCTYCEKTFKEKRFLTEHTAIHMGRKDYSCKYCLREFRSQSNMRKHIRQQHVAEYAQEQAQKKYGRSVEDSKNILNSS